MGREGFGSLFSDTVAPPKTEGVQPLQWLCVSQLGAWHSQGIQLPPCSIASLPLNAREALFQTIASEKRADDDTLKLLVHQEMPMLNVAWCTKISADALAQTVSRCSALVEVNFAGLQCKVGEF
jgi:hypothetical protein